MLFIHYYSFFDYVNNYIKKDIWLNIICVFGISHKDYMVKHNKNRCHSEMAPVRAVKDRSQYFYFID